MTYESCNLNSGSLPALGLPGRPALKLVLLPGMDGTGELFHDFVAALPEEVETEVVSYPRHARLSHPELAALVRRSVSSVEPFVLLAESFSTPLAIECAARNDPNLKAVILCAGFVTSPVSRAVGLLFHSWSPLFRVKLSKFLVRRLFVGQDAPRSLVDSTHRNFVDPAGGAVFSRSNGSRLRCTCGAKQVRCPHLVHPRQAGPPGQ